MLSVCISSKDLIFSFSVFAVPELLVWCDVVLGWQYDVLSYTYFHLLFFSIESSQWLET